MSEKCKTCAGRGASVVHRHLMLYGSCDGTGVDLATCEGVPPGSDAEEVLCHWPTRKLHTWNEFYGEHYCRPGICSVVGIRFPSRLLPDGTRETLVPDPGRCFRKPCESTALNELVSNPYKLEAEK